MTMTLTTTGKYVFNGVTEDGEKVDRTQTESGEKVVIKTSVVLQGGMQ